MSEVILLSKLKCWNGNEWDQIAPSMNEFGILSNLKIKSATYTSGTDTLSVTFYPGVAETFNGNTIVTITKTTEIILDITPVSGSITYTLFLKNDGNFDKSTDGTVVDGAALIGTVASNIDKTVFTITDKRPIVSATGNKLTAHLAESATETVKGHVELATAAETTAGTDNTRAVHPAGLKVELDKKINKPISAVADRIAVFDTDQNAVKDSGKTISDLGVNMNSGGFTEATSIDASGGVYTKSVPLGSSDYKLAIVRFTDVAASYSGALVITKTTINTGSCIAAGQYTTTYQTTGATRGTQAYLTQDSTKASIAVSGTDRIVLEHCYINGSNLELKWKNFGASPQTLNVSVQWEVFK